MILHYTAMRASTDALARLCDSGAEVSAHYVIEPGGQVWSLVPEERRAWHAGKSAWGAVRDVNSRSIGIELVNTGRQPFPEPQMHALESLLDAVRDRWSVPPERVIGHSDIAIGRKVDPGPRFDWRRLARRGHAVWPDQATPGDFEEDARRAGYVWEAGQEDALLAAVRLRLRPWATGPLGAVDRALVAGLARDWPVAAEPAQSTS
ncbi:N-acetylmuramoyl-L-alanine amidase AmiD precursor [Roseivivax jejudonensis]|uniref:N-acetylmuramoyl-L-alanine amidase n=1 Tax=Roseivivax jejudonensis TaxID=1529041 RepID=A0A1X6YQB1_9RHOB|nr:N-acetylmuramoyl-L-alanine amidase AmiD precursor [Roseivivax jejudonensis]